MAEAGESRGGWLSAGAARGLLANERTLGAAGHDGMGDSGVDESHGGHLVGDQKGV